MDEKKKPLSNKNPASELKRIRSFVLRQGRMTAAQRKAIDEHWSEYVLEVEQGKISPERVFNRSAPLILEIGFGNGDSLIKMMADNPEKNYIGVEVHRPGVGSLINKTVENNYSNLKVYCDDAVLVMQNCIPDNSLDGVQVFFPDPWHKKKHKKRRLIQDEFVKLIASKLKKDGIFHLATDWQDYAEQMMEVISKDKNFINNSGAGQYSERPETRALTRFESRGQRLGHGVWDLIFSRAPGAAQN